MKNWCLNNSYITSVSMFFVKKNDIWITCVKDSKKWLKQAKKDPNNLNLR